MPVKSWRQNTLFYQLRLLILINWKEEGKWPFFRCLKDWGIESEILQPVSFRQPASKRFTRISIYLSEFYLPVSAVFRKKKWDVIISWQMRIGICYGILKRMFHARKPPVHIIQDFHIDLTQTRWLYRIKTALLKQAIPGIDYFFCTSTEEETIYSQLFGIPRSRIAFLPLIPPMPYFAEPDRLKTDYIFSYGNSDRDYDTLIRAVSHMNIHTVILSQKYKPHIQLPDNVSIIRDWISESALIQKIASCRIAVLPLNDYRIAAGQISMLQVMALGRPLIITENMATKEYATPLQTALFFEAGNCNQLAEHIQYLWNHRQIAEEIGQQARKFALKLNNNRMTIFRNVMEHYAMAIQKGVRK
jgi:glycosyltransferase involved in cell wall biosynthesis